MADYQRIVEYLRDIRVNIGAGTTSVTDELRESATAYAELCVQANDRLRQCSSFLQQGLRSEAIHLAEESPNLLDLVAALDLPDANQWGEFCQMNELPIPVPLQMDRAQQLNEAYAADQPLETLLNQHRYLALARAPVGQRLSVLRQISTQDPSNPNWEKDVRVFEKARIKELPNSFYIAVKNKDSAALAELHSEINETPWAEEIPTDLALAVTDAHKRFRRAQADAELRPLVAPLRQAFAARDYDACVSIIARWKAVMEAAGITTVAPELAHEVQPVVEWVRSEDEAEEQRKRFRAGCDALVGLLNTDASDSDLEAAFERLKSFDEPVPAELAERYTQRRAARQKVAERAHRLRLVTVAACVFLVLAVCGAGAYYMYTAGNASRWAQRITDAVNRRDLDLAHHLIAEQEKTDAGLSGATEVRTAKAAVVDLEVRHTEATKRLEDIIKSLTDAKTQAGPIVANAVAAPSELLAVARSVGLALTEQAGEDLTWVDRDGKLPPLRKEVAELQTQLLQRANSIVKEAVEKLKAELAGISVPTTADSPAANATLLKINGIGEQLGRMRSVTGIDAEAIAAIDAAAAAVDAKRKLAEASNQFAAALQDVRREAISADRLKAALTRFIAAFPDQPITADFKRALNALPTAKAVEAYAGLLRGWTVGATTTPLRLYPDKASTAQKRIEEIQAYLAANPASPLTGPLERYADYLRRMLDALSEKGAWQAGFGELLSNPLLADLGFLETSDGQRYFVLGSPKIVNRGINNQRSVSFQVIDPKKPDKTLTVEVNSPTTVLNMGRPTPLPHAKIVQELATEMKRIDEGNWETFGIDTLEKLQLNLDMDLYVKAILVLHTLQAQQAVLGPTLSDLYEKPLRELKRLDPENIVWYDRDHPVAEITRKAVKATLDGLPSADTARKTLASRKEALAKSVLFIPDGTGVLLRDEDGHYQVAATGGSHAANAAWAALAPSGAPAAAPHPAPAPATAPTEPALGVTAVPDAGGALLAPNAAAGSLVKIAIFATDKWKPLDDAPPDVPQGTMLFMARP